MSNPVLAARSRVGVAVRLGDPAAEQNARRELAAAKLAEYIRRTVAEAPELTPEQRERLAVLLRGGDGA